MFSNETFKKKCRLCDMNISDTNFKLIDTVIKDILNHLLIKLKFDDDIQYLVCSICNEKLIAALDFKSLCLKANNTIIPYVDIRKPSLVDLKEIYVKENGNNTLDDKHICRLCMHPTNDEYISVEKTQDFAVQMYIPEIDFKVTVDPIICNICQDSLFTHISFIKNCLNVEQRTCKNDSPIMDAHFNDSDIKTEDIEIKHEVENEENQEKLYEIQFVGIPIKQEIKQESDQSLFFFDNGANVDNIEQCNSEHLQQTRTPMINIKTDEHYSEACSTNTYEIGVEENTDLIKYQKVEDTSEVQTDKYRECKLEVKPIQGSTVHELEDTSGRRMYNCRECEFETKYKQSMKCHQLKHKHPSEVQMHKCNECEFETVYIHSLRKHQLTHRNSSEVQMIKCSECNYETKFKEYLVRHQKTHKDSSELQMYKCGECKFETKYKNNFKKHHLIHKDPSEVQRFKCGECTYETSYKKNLMIHQLKHKGPSEVQMYKCDECEYETKNKRYLTKHQWTHKDPSDVQMFKCSECTYETKFRENLIRHQLKHKDPSEVKMYKCSECEFETKYRSDLRKHQLRHKKRSNILT